MLFSDKVWMNFFLN